MNETDPSVLDAAVALTRSQARRRLADRIRDPRGWHRFFTPHAAASPAGVFVIAVLVAWARPHEWLLFLLVLAEMLAISLNLMSTTRRLEAVSALLDHAGALDRFAQDGAISPKL